MAGSVITCCAKNGAFMSQYQKIASMLMAVCFTAGVMAAPLSPKAEGRSRAIDLLAEGQSLEQQGNKEEAWQKYYESAQAAPSPSAYYHLGKLARQAGQKDSARQWLAKALELNPKFELAKVEMASLNEGGQSSAVVSTVSNELKGSIAPGSADALNTPMNVDALRREVLTMQSLAPPEVRTQTPEEIAAAETPEPATPNDIKLDDSASGDSVMSPVIDPKDPESLSLPSLSETADAGSAAKSGGNGASKTDEPSRADINDAAFGAESQKEPGSIGYGQSSEIVLGTYAFHRQKGDDYRKANRFREAAVEYKTALEISPDNTEVRTLLAEMYGRIGQENKAETQFTKAKAQSPTDDRIYYKEGNAYFDDQNYDLAIGSFRKALDLNPQNKLALNNMGVAYMEKKDYATAADKFKQVLELDPAYDMAVLNLGIIYDEHIIDKDQALKYYNRYIELKGPRATEVQRWADAIRAKPSQ
jgi:tetratricopeptide (TPR) repeat protein